MRWYILVLASSRSSEEPRESLLTVREPIWTRLSSFLRSDSSMRGSSGEELASLLRSLPRASGTSGEELVVEIIGLAFEIACNVDACDVVVPSLLGRKRRLRGWPLSGEEMLCLGIGTVVLFERLGDGTADSLYDESLAGDAALPTFSGRKRRRRDRLRSAEELLSPELEPIALLKRPCDGTSDFRLLNALCGTPLSSDALSDT